MGSTLQTLRYCDERQLLHYDHSCYIRCHSDVVVAAYDAKLEDLAGVQRDDVVQKLQPLHGPRPSKSPSRHLGP